MLRGDWGVSRGWGSLTRAQWSALVSKGQAKGTGFSFPALSAASSSGRGAPAPKGTLQSCRRGGGSSTNLFEVFLKKYRLWQQPLPTG